MKPIEVILATMADCPERQAHVLDRIGRHQEAGQLAGQLIELLKDAGAIGSVEAARAAIAAGGPVTVTACSLVRLTAFDDWRLSPAEGGR